MENEFILDIKNDDTWMIRLTKNGTFLFNTQDFPNMTISDFTQSFVSAVVKMQLFKNPDGSTYSTDDLVQEVEGLRKALQDANDIIYGLRARLSDPGKNRRNPTENSGGYQRVELNTIR